MGFYGVFCTKMFSYIIVANPNGIESIERLSILCLATGRFRCFSHDEPFLKLFFYMQLSTTHVQNLVKILQDLGKILLRSWQDIEQVPA